MRQKEILIKGKKAQACEIELGAKKLIVIKAEKGYLACGYLDLKTAELLQEAAVIVKGVDSWGEMLEKEITAFTKVAAELGIKEGMQGKEALEKLI